MNITAKHSARIVAVLLLSAAATQALYTALALGAPEIDRTPIWSTEALIFTLLAAFAAAAMARSKGLALGWGAVFASAILNVVQVGIGLTMFRPFFEVASAAEAFAPAASAVVAYSFFVYNAAKLLLALAAIVFGSARATGGSGLAKALGWTAVLVGAVALVANGASMAMGRDVFGELPLAGGSGVLATLLLALCLPRAQPD